MEVGTAVTGDEWCGWGGTSRRGGHYTIPCQVGGTGPATTHGWGPRQGRRSDTKGSTCALGRNVCRLCLGSPVLIETPPPRTRRRVLSLSLDVSLGVSGTPSSTSDVRRESVDGCRPVTGDNKYGPWLGTLRSPGNRPQKFRSPRT